MKRDEIAIMRDILKLTRSPKASTKILYGANLSYTQFMRYLDLLVGRGFLEVAGRSPPTYVTTRKGALFLRLLGVLGQSKPVTRDNSTLEHLER